MSLYLIKSVDSKANFASQIYHKCKLVKEVVCVSVMLCIYNEVVRTSL